MCTVVAIAGAGSLVVGANRDEHYARATRGPRRLDDGVVVSGIDGAHGGSWMGANDAGIVVALTNQRQLAGADPSKASRGRVVLDALARRDVPAIDAWLATLDGRAYNGFNLLYGAADVLRVAYARPERQAIEVFPLGEGVWVLPNDRLGSPDFPKAARARALVAPHVEGGWPALRAHLPSVLADHAMPPLEEIAPPPPGALLDRALLQRLQAICIHTPIYGTRSSSIVALSAGRVERYLHAEGAPCERDFADLTELFA
ncbi:MAG: NRDE family protein [Sandaracinaceae bacterium]|nr:NRDE family protein [Sandaracinaceae bacterium]